MLNALPNISKSVVTEASSRGIYVFTAFKRLLERNQTGIFINGWEDRPVKTGNISVHCCFLLPTGGILSSLAATRVNFIYNPQLTATLYMCTAPQEINSHDQFAVSVTVVDKQPPARPGPLKQVAPMVSPKQVAAGSQARKPAPPVKQPAPPVKQPAPPVKQPAPPVKQPAPPVKQPAPQVKQPAPPVKQPAPQVKQPASEVKQPASQVKQPASQVKQPAPPVKQPAPPVKQPASQVKQPAPPVKQPAPQVKQPASQVKQPASQVKQPASQVKQPAPPVKQPAPQVKQPAPPVKQPAHPVTQPAPPVKQPAPRVKQTAPPVKQTAPRVKQTAPPVKQPARQVKQTAPPVKQPAAPVKQTAPQVKQPAPPVKQPAPPVTQPAPPVKQPAPQVKQPAPHVKQTASQVKQPASQVKQPAPPVKQPAPQVKQPASQVKQPAPPVKQPAPQVKQPASQVKQPAPPVTQPAPPVKQPAPPVTQPAPPVKQPAPPVTQPAPPVKQPAPQVKQPAPQVKQPAPQVKQPASQVKQPASQVKQPAPPVKQPAPQVKQPAPPVKQPAPQVKQPAPQVKQTAAEVAGNQTAIVIEKVQTDQVKKPVPPHPQRKPMTPKQPVKKQNPVSAKQNCSNKNVQNTCSTDTLENKGEILNSSDLLKLIAQNKSVTSRKLLSINSSSSDNDKLNQSDTAVKQTVPTAESQPVIKSYSNIVCPTHPNFYVMPLEAIDVETANNIPGATDGAHLLEEKENIANKDPVIIDSKTPVKQVLKGNGPPGENNFSFAVCAKIIYGHADVELTIEWMEYYRRMGTSKVLAFTYNLTETAQKVIRHYEDMGFLETLPFEFPRPDNPKRTVGQKNAQAWNDEQVTIYHCHDRLINYKFLGVLDFDEFIIPLKDRNFKELFTQLLKSQKFASVFVFPHMVHVQEWNKTRKDSLKITSYLDHTKNLGYNLKAVYLPERVTEGKVFTHGLLAHKPGTQSVHVLGTIAQLSHYRMKCRPEWVKESNCFNKTLVRTTRIMEIVDEDLRTTIQKKKKLLLNID